MPSGSKTQVIERYKTYIRSKNGKSLFLLDRDWDHVTGKIIQDKFVIYTCGYSYENDICLERSIEDVVLLYCLQEGDREFISSLIQNNMRKQIRYLSRMVRADRAARLRGISGISSSNYRDFLVESPYGSEPSVSIKNMRKFIKDSSKKLPRCNKILDRNVEWRMSLVGHFVFNWFFHTIAHIVKLYAKDIKLRKNEVKRFLVSRFVERLREDICIVNKEYYADRLAAIL